MPSEYDVVKMGERKGKINGQNGIGMPASLRFICCDATDHEHSFGN